MAQRLESEITRKYRKTRRRYDPPAVVPQMIEALTHIEGARYPTHADMTDEKRQKQLIDDTISRFTDGSTMVSLDQTSFGSSKIYEGPRHDPNKSKFATHYELDVIKGIMRKEPEEPQTQSNLAIWVDNPPTEPPKKPKKVVQFNKEAQQVTYERHDYFTADQSIFRDRNEMAEAFTYAQQSAGSSHKQIQIPVTDAEERQKELVEQMNQQVTNWSGNVLQLGSKAVQPYQQQTQQTQVNTGAVQPTVAIETTRTEVSQLPHSIYKKDYRYYLSGNPEQNLNNAVGNLSGYQRNMKYGGFGDQILGLKRHEEEDKEEQEKLKKESQRQAHMKHFLGVDQSNAQLLSRIGKPQEDTDSASERPASETYLASKYLPTQSDATRQDASRAETSRPPQSQSKANTQSIMLTRSIVEKARYKQDIAKSVGQFRSMSQTELENLHSTLHVLDNKAQDEDADDVLTRDEALEASRQSAMIRDSIDIEMDQSIDMLRKQFQSGRYDESQQHQLALRLEQGIVGSIGAEQWLKMESHIGQHQQGYSTLYENRIPKPKHYQPHDKELFTNFTKNVQQPLDAIHQASDTQQIMSVDQRARMLELRQIYLDSKSMPTPQFNANLEHFVSGEKMNYAMRKGGNEAEKLFRTFEQNVPGNLHMSLENRLREFDPDIGAKAKLDVQTLRSLYHYDIDQPQVQPLDKVYRAPEANMKMAKQQESASMNVLLMGDLGSQNLQQHLRKATQRIVYT